MKNKNLKFRLKKDKHDERDFRFSAHPLAAVSALPSFVDLRSKMSPVVDQGNLGSCTANAIASGLREYLMLVNGESYHPLSRLYLYWHERELEGTINEDSGAYLRDGMKVLANLGVSEEQYFPYVESTFTSKPTDAAETNAGKYKITAYHRVILTEEWKAALAGGMPVVMGIQIYSSFMTDAVSTTGKVPLPNPAKETLYGGHAVLAVGYDDAAQHVICRNSWGTGWGDKGYFYLPYSYFTDYVMDMWVAEYTPAPPTFETLTLDDALTIFAERGIFDSPDFWKSLASKYEGDETSDFRYVALAFRKLAAYIKDSE